MIEENNSYDGDKKAILRSAAYPNITIEEALEIVSQIKRSFPTSQFDREDITAVLKRTNITRDIGAAVQYGLVDKTMGKGYKLSNRVQLILNFVTEQERSNALIDCFKNPKLYSELIERFKGHAIPGDQQFRAILIRYHGITENAAPQAIDIFIENAIYCGVLNEKRILFAENPIENDLKPIDKATMDNYEPLISHVNSAQKEEKSPFLLQEINGSIDLKIHLSERKIAHLIYPDNVNEKDIQILKLQLEALSLTL